MRTSPLQAALPQPGHDELAVAEGGGRQGDGRGGGIGFDRGPAAARVEAPSRGRRRAAVPPRKPRSDAAPRGSARGRGRLGTSPSTRSSPPPLPRRQGQEQAAHLLARPRASQGERPRTAAPPGSPRASRPRARRGSARSPRPAGLRTGRGSGVAAGCPRPRPGRTVASSGPRRATSEVSSRARVPDSPTWKRFRRQGPCPAQQPAQAGARRGGVGRVHPLRRTALHGHRILAGGREEVDPLGQRLGRRGLEASPHPGASREATGARHGRIVGAAAS